VIFGSRMLRLTPKVQGARNGNANEKRPQESQESYQKIRQGNCAIKEEIRRK